MTELVYSLGSLGRGPELMMQGTLLDEPNPIR